MPTIKEWILEEANGEPVLGVVFGSIGRSFRLCM